MDFSNLQFYQNKILFGHDDTKNIVAVEVDDKSDPSKVTVFIRNNGKVESFTEEFQPFVIVKSLNYLIGFKLPYSHRELSGRRDFKHIVFVPNMATLKKLLAYLKSVTGSSFGSPKAPYLYYSDMVHQYLLLTGKTLFLGMMFEDLHRMQIDIETYCKEGYEFSNPDREEDRIIMISMSDSRGWERVISGTKYDEPDMLKEMVREIRERDPDVIEGHNFFKFDLDYIEKRAKRHNVKLNVGRDGSALKRHSSRMHIAERTIVYPKYEIYGRHIADTWILAQLYDVSARELESYGLKDVARHFRVSPPDRTYVDPQDIAHLFDTNPEKLERYALDDVRETNAISRILSVPYFMQTQIFPFSYQNVTVRGNATRIDSLFIREYIHSGYSIPKPPRDKKYAGGYTDIFYEGVAHNILHVDVASLYPSIILSFEYFPKKDDRKIFETLLEDLREFRLMAKKEAREAKDPDQADFFNSLQTTFKILINSFYGYLGFRFGHFADFEMAENVTAKGREILESMVKQLQDRGCKLIELDTDGIYFTPPPDTDTRENEEKLVEELNSTLPEGINLELDGRYKSMFSYKMKNYILLDYDGTMLVTGSGLKSRGLEYFQRKFIEEMFHLLLTDKKKEIQDLLISYRLKIMNHEWNVRWFQKSETLQESLATYTEKVENKKRNRAAVYELAQKSGRDYEAGDRISYYVTGTRKSVTAYKNCQFAYKWDPENPDENVKYYIGKLESLYKKFKKYVDNG